MSADHNLYGQEMHNKGRTTRKRIMDATAELMSKVSIRDLRPVEIGRVAGVSKATFYIYFDSVEDAALAVVETTNQSTPKIMAILDSNWTPQDVLDRCRDFVRVYTTYWKQHHAIMRVRNLAADEGDARFFQARRQSIEPIHFALQRQIAAFQHAGTCSLQFHPPSTASVLLATLERLSAVLCHASVHGATRKGQVESAALLLVGALCPMALNAQDDSPS